MNKQELIEKIEKEKSPFNAWEDLTRNNALNDALAIVRKLDEPEKPVVPQYVADWYESIKDDFEDKVYDLCVQFNFDESELNSDVAGWFGHSKNKPIETLVLMHKFGYEVEKEKLYTVEIPNNLTLTHIILTRNIGGEINLIETQNNDWEELEYAQLTKDEIKKDFEWAWQFAKEVEYD